MINEKIIACAQKLADIAGETARHYFRRSIESSFKSKEEIVTEADFVIEKSVRQHIEQIFPSHNIMGEELPFRDLCSDYTWVIDPIDGTTSFICGKPMFCTLIGLLFRNQPVLGIIDQPIVRERWLGVMNRITLLNNTPCTITASDDAFIRLNCTSPHMFSKQELRIFEEIQKSVSVCSWGGDGYAYGLLASGFIDVIVENNLKFYDAAALIPIINGMGGMITNWKGEGIDASDFDGSVLATRSKKTHRRIIKKIKNS